MLKKLALFAVLALTPACVLLPDFSPIPQDRNDVDKGRAAFETANYALALEYLVPCAEKGDVDAQYVVGLIYLYGLTGERNYFLAQKYLTMAANENHYAAQELLAFMYSDPYRPLYNPIDAHHWFKIVSARNPAYQSNLDDLRWTLKSRGLLEKANAMAAPRNNRYHGVDYNSLFLFR